MPPCTHTCVYIYIYIYICTCIYIYVYNVLCIHYTHIYIYISRYISSMLPWLFVKKTTYHWWRGSYYRMPLYILFPIAMPARHPSQDVPGHVLGDGQTGGVGVGATCFKHSLSYEEVPADPSNYKSVLAMRIQMGNQTIFKYKHIYIYIFTTLYIFTYI